MYGGSIVLDDKSGHVIVLLQLVHHVRAAPQWFKRFRIVESLSFLKKFDSFIYKLL